MADQPVVYRAAWVVPIASPPVRGGWVEVAGGRIVRLGPPGTLGGDGRPVAVDLGEVAVLPGLVNAHAHLELSWMRDRVPPAPAMPEWVRTLMRERRASGDDVTAIAPAIAEMHASGTAAVGDVGNTLASVGPLSASPLAAVVFHEVVGFNPTDPRRLVEEAAARAAAVPAGTVRVRLAAHAPYSVHPEVLRVLGGLRRAGGSRPMSVHVGESAEELQFLADGTGAWRRLLDDLGTWNPRWEPPGTGPVAYLEGAGLLGEGALAVHAVQLRGPELARLAEIGATLVTCPRSNRWTGAGDPPVADFYASGVPVAVGTDGLASCPDLNLFAELAAMRALAPGVPPRRLLESATLEGARALGVDRDLGSLECGKRAALLAVALPGEVADVEAHLVAGVDPSRVGWVTGPGAAVGAARFAGE